MFAQCFPLYQIPCFNLVRQEINGALILGSIWFWLKLRKLEAYGTFMASAFKFFMNPTSIRKRIRCGWEELYIYMQYGHLFSYGKILFFDFQTCSAWSAHATNAFLLPHLPICSFASWPARLLANQDPWFSHAHWKACCHITVLLQFVMCFS